MLKIPEISILGVKIAITNLDDVEKYIYSNLKKNKWKLYLCF